MLFRPTHSSVTFPLLPSINQILLKPQNHTSKKSWGRKIKPAATMFEESMSVIPNLWSSMNSWFTPTVLFLLLNLMIGVIAVTSGLISQKTPHQERESQLPPSPSVLQRIKSSSNFFQSRSPEQRHQYQIFDETQVHKRDEHQVPDDESSSVTEEIQEATHDVKLGQKSIDEVYGELQESVHFSRTKSEPVAGEALLPLPAKRIMKKSASAKPTFAKFSLEDDDEDDVIAVESRRPATMREMKTELEVDGVDDDDDEEVDAKADDFINRFKHQLKLQKLDSIIRNKEEMLARGSIGGNK